MRGQLSSGSTETSLPVLPRGNYYLRVFNRRGKNTYRLKLETQTPPRFLSTLNGGEIGTINLRTGKYKPFIQNALGGTEIFTDLAYNRATNEFYGTSFRQLYRIDPQTRTVALVGDLGIDNLNALEFDAAGNLYGTGRSSFYFIDKTTGTATRIADITNFSSSGDLAFDVTTNRFYATSRGLSTDSLFSIGLDGSATRIGDIGFAKVFGLILDQGTLYGYTNDQNQLVLDPVTGAGFVNRPVAGATSSIAGAT